MVCYDFEKEPPTFSFFVNTNQPLVKFDRIPGLRLKVVKSKISTFVGTVVREGGMKIIFPFDLLLLPILMFKL